MFIALVVVVNGDKSKIQLHPPFPIIIKDNLWSHGYIFCVPDELRVVGIAEHKTMRERAKRI